MKTFISILAVCFLYSTAIAARVDTVSTYSTCMNKSIKAVVITPDTYSSKKLYPVVYLLHGYSGNYGDWLLKAPALTEYSDLYDVIIVCADGNFSSWYFDSPESKEWQYETYVSKELVSWIDAKYSTIRNRTGRGITGLSMGGHGALYLAFKHQDQFGVAASMSGGVDIRPFPKNWNIKDRLGAYDTHKEIWDQNTVINMVYLLSNNPPALMIDCGTDDFFFKVNEKLHEKLLENNIPHDYISRPGGHTSEYWSNSIQYHLLFMNNYFKRNKK